MDISDCRIIHYVGQDGHHWPLLVTSVADDDIKVNGHVFRDADSIRVTDVPYSDELVPHSWHWRERIP